MPDLSQILLLVPFKVTVWRCAGDTKAGGNTFGNVWRISISHAPTGETTTVYFDHWFILLHKKLLNLCMVFVWKMTLTIMCLEGLGLDYLPALAAHHQVEVILCGTLTKYWHVCTWKTQPEWSQVKKRLIKSTCIHLAPQLRAQSELFLKHPSSIILTWCLEKNLNNTMIFLQPLFRAIRQTDKQINLNKEFLIAPVQFYCSFRIILGLLYVGILRSII